MGKSDYLALGDWNAQCDSCGHKYKASQLKLQWDGFRTCNTCYDFRQPQDFVRGVEDKQAPPWTRPEPAPTFVEAVADLEPVPSGVE